MPLPYISCNIARPLILLLCEDFFQKCFQFGSLCEIILCSWMQGFFSPITLSHLNNNLKIMLYNPQYFKLVIMREHCDTITIPSTFFNLKIGKFLFSESLLPSFFFSTVSFLFPFFSQWKSCYGSWILPTWFKAGQCSAKQLDERAKDLNAIPGSALCENGQVM